MCFWCFKKKTPNKEKLYGDDENKVYARHFVLKHCKELDGDGIGSSSKEHIHAYVIGFDDFSWAIARQLAFVCHFPNFDDKTGKNRTVITVINDNPKNDDELESELRKTVGDFMLQECCWTCRMVEKGKSKVVAKSKREESYIDIEFEVIGLSGITVDDYFTNKSDPEKDEIVSVICPKEALKADMTSKCRNLYQYDIKQLGAEVPGMDIDITRAMLVNIVYDWGVYLSDVCSWNMYEVENYNMALETFCSRTPHDWLVSKWGKTGTIELKLSNLLCADCLELKKRSAEKASNEKGLQKKLEKDLVPLSKAEHARWNVEKLLLGYRPYTPEERYKDEYLFGEERRKERKRMKNEEKAHIDICSCSELRRVDMENMKYDCFLTLTIDDIIERTKS